jgi:hypothetical protein
MAIIDALADHGRHRIDRPGLIQLHEQGGEFFLGVTGL